MTDSELEALAKSATENIGGCYRLLNAEQWREITAWALRLKAENERLRAVAIAAGIYDADPSHARLVQLRNSLIALLPGDMDAS